MVLRQVLKESIDIAWNVSYNNGSDAGWSSLAARRAHNPKVVGSNPAPATKDYKRHYNLLF